MNWGHKIIIVYIVFVIGMLFLAYQSSRQNIELVTEDYYAKELLYQQKIDQTKRTNLLSAPVRIDIINHELVIVFPGDFAQKKIIGDLVLYCPADEKKDMHQSFAIKDNALTILLDKRYRGLRCVKINWNADGVTYYYEKKIII